MAKSAQRKNSSKKSNIKKQVILFCSCCAVGLVLLITGFNLNSFFDDRRVLGSKTQIEENASVKLAADKEFWNNFLQENPDYFEGWIELAGLYAQSEEFDLARLALDKAKQINPNSKETGNLEEQLK